VRSPVVALRVCTRASTELASHTQSSSADASARAPRAQRGAVLHFYSDEKEYKHAEFVNTLYTEAGLERNAISPQQLAEIEPALANGNDYIGGFFTPCADRTTQHSDRTVPHNTRRAYTNRARIYTRRAYAPCVAQLRLYG
jgi:hypothetical protein